MLAAWLLVASASASSYQGYQVKYSKDLCKHDLQMWRPDVNWSPAPSSDFDNATSALGPKNSTVQNMFWWKNWGCDTSQSDHGITSPSFCGYHAWTYDKNNCFKLCDELNKLHTANSTLHPKCEYMSIRTLDYSELRAVEQKAFLSNPWDQYKCFPIASGKCAAKDQSHSACRNGNAFCKDETHVKVDPAAGNCDFMKGASIDSTYGSTNKFQCTDIFGVDVPFYTWDNAKTNTTCTDANGNAVACTKDQCCTAPTTSTCGGNDGMTCGVGTAFKSSAAACAHGGMTCTQSLFQNNCCAKKCAEHFWKFRGNTTSNGCHVGEFKEDNFCDDDTCQSCCVKSCRQVRMQCSAGTKLKKPGDKDFFCGDDCTGEKCCLKESNEDFREDSFSGKILKGFDSTVALSLPHSYIPIICDLAYNMKHHFGLDVDEPNTFPNQVIILSEGRTNAQKCSQVWSEDDDSMAIQAAVITETDRMLRLDYFNPSDNGKHYADHIPKTYFKRVTSTRTDPMTGVVEKVVSYTVSTDTQFNGKTNPMGIITFKKAQIFKWDGQHANSKTSIQSMCREWKQSIAESVADFVGRRLEEKERVLDAVLKIESALNDDITE